MGQISVLQARGLFLDAFVAIYKERSFTTSFLRSFFSNKESNTKLLSIAVKRGTEKIAVDVQRGTEGNRNSMSISSLKKFKPPYYREYFDATELDFYDTLWNSEGTVDAVTFNQWLNDIVEKIAELQDMIERSYEVQCKHILETGIVPLINEDNIDFKRKAGSLVANTAGNTWLTDTVSPYVSLEAGANFIRTEGKASGDIFNVIMGSTAYNHFLGNAIVKSRADNRKITLDEIRMPQRNSTGGTLHGQVSAGSYKFNLWTYPQFYDTSSFDHNPYIDPKKIIILPESPNFVLGFAAVPRLMGKKSDVGAGIGSEKGAFSIGEYLDERNSAHIIDIKSAGVAIPVAVDMIYTEQVVA